MTTAADVWAPQSIWGDERGQSVLEFLLMLPLMAGLSVMLVKVNSAIQVGINNQQYARAHALWLTFGSPVYPERKFRFNTDDSPKDTFAGYNQMVVGVSDNVAPDRESGEAYIPEATVQKIARQGRPQGSDDPQSEPDERGKVRVRATVTLCTQSNWIGKNFAPVSSRIPEDAVFDDGYRYCRGMLE